MKIAAKNAGIASSRLSHWISLKEASIITPTTIRAGEEAAAGTMATTGAKKALSAKRIATTTEVRPVRPPAPIPAALSTYVVVLEVPKRAPIEVAMESANNALSIFDLNPGAS